MMDEAAPQPEGISILEGNLDHSGREDRHALQDAMAFYRYKRLASNPLVGSNLTGGTARSATGAARSSGLGRAAGEPTER